MKFNNKSTKLYEILFALGVCVICTVSGIKILTDHLDNKRGQEKITEYIINKESISKDNMIWESLSSDGSKFNIYTPSNIYLVDLSEIDNIKVIIRENEEEREMILMD